MNFIHKYLFGIFSSRVLAVFFFLYNLHIYCACYLVLFVFDTLNSASWIFNSYYFFAHHAFGGNDFKYLQ